MIINWEEKYSVKVQELDDHHKQLVNLMNELYEAIKSGNSTTEISVILDKLIDYTKFHFSSEEKFMIKCGYPGYDKHKSAHEQFVNKILEYQIEFKEGNLLLGMDVMNFLIKWLIRHISIEDKKYGIYFALNRDPAIAN